MLPVIPKPAITPAQKKAAIAVAGTIDLLQLVFIPALLPGIAIDEALDVIAAIALTAICGFRWQFVLAFSLELVPIADWLPTWTAVALLLRSSGEPIQASPPTYAGVIPAPPVQSRPAPAADDIVDVEVVTVPPVQPQALPSSR